MGGKQRRGRQTVSRRIRSSSPVGLPRPSRFEVRIHSEPSGASCTARSRPYSPCSSARGVPVRSLALGLDILGEQVVPVLRTEFAALRPAGVPEEPPTHGSLVADAAAELAAEAVR